MRTSAALLAALAVATLAVAAVPNGTAHETPTSVNGTLDDPDEESGLKTGVGQPVSGSTDLVFGRTVTVVVEADGEIRRFDATVGPGGEFETGLNLTWIDGDANATLELRHDGATLDAVDAHVSECSGTCIPTGNEAADETEPPTDTVWTNHVTSARWGDTVGVPVTFGNESALTLVVDGSPFVDYQRTVTIRDGNDDGLGVVQFETDPADGEPVVSSAYDGDEIARVEAGPNSTGPLPAETFDVTVYRGESTAREAALGTLDVRGTSSSQSPNGTISHDGDRLTLAAGPGQEITGETDLEPGSEVTVRIESEDPARPFVIRPEVTVAEDGRFTAVVNLSHGRVGTNFTAELRHGGETLDEVDGRIVECDGDCEPVPETETPTHTPLDADSPGLASVVQVTQGETARIPMAFGERDALTFVVDGEEDVDYRLDATVRDGDGDGRATLLLNTSAAGDPPRTLTTVGNSDTVELIEPEPLRSVPLNATEYHMYLFPEGVTEGDWLTINTLSVNEPATPTETTEPARTTTADDPDTPTETDGAPTRTGDATPTPGLTADDGDSGGFDLGGAGALAAGGLLAVVGIGLLLGVFRS